MRYFLLLLLSFSVHSANLNVPPKSDAYGEVVRVASTVDYFLDVAEGDEGGSAAIAKFGEAPDIDTADGFLTIWGNKAATLGDRGNYTPPTTARLHNIVSTSTADVGTVLSSGTVTTGTTTVLEDSSATFSTDTVAAGDLVLNDTNDSIGIVTTVDSETKLSILGVMRQAANGRANGANANGDAYRIVTNGSTGASVIHIDGLDISRLEQEEFVVLNGTTDVATATAYVAMNRAKTFGVASTQDNTGTITATAQTDSTVTLQIQASENQTMQAVYTVPINKDGYIYRWWGALSKKGTASARIVLWVGILDGYHYPIQPRSLNSTGNSSFSDRFSLPLFIPGGASVWVAADSDTNNIGVSAGFDVILVDK